MDGQFLEVLKLVVVSYLLLVALSALVGRHRPLVAYPMVMLYSATKLFLFVFSLGRLRLAPVVKRQRMRQTYRFRAWSQLWRHWRGESQSAKRWRQGR